MTRSSLLPVLLYGGACLLPRGVHAQERARETVSVDFDSARVETFARALESQARGRFFYDSLAMDSLRVTLSAHDRPLEAVLHAALDHTGYFFAVDAAGHVFLTKGFTLSMTLPPGFSKADSAARAHPGNAEANQPPAEAGPNIVEEEEHTSVVQVSALENKLFEIGERGSATRPGSAHLAGYVRDAKTGEPVGGATVYVDNPHNGVAADQYGYFAISLSRGRHTLYVQSIGMRDTRRQLQVNGDGRLNVDMQSQVLTLRNVVISSEKASNIRSLEMGIQRLDIKSIKQVPVVFGEPDVLRVVLTLPGVKSVGESSTGLNVRGGSADQNLILFNDATIYNPSHFFGLFSAFDPEVVKDVELYKSSIPARYGGRLSSVLDVSSREGNKRAFTGSAGIGLLTSRFNLEGPLDKDKSSFVIGARTTYADWLLNDLPAQYKNSKASFNDVTVGVTEQVNRKNTLYLTGYMSNDKFNLNSDTTYSYGNRNASLKWKHIYGSRLTSEVSTGYDHYQYNIRSTNDTLTASALSFNISQGYLRLHFNEYLSAKHTLQFGASSLYYKLHPGMYVPEGKGSLVVADTLQAEQALESALYISDEYKVTNAFSVEAGIRYSMFDYLGPSLVNNYAAGLPVTVNDQTGTTYYGKGKVINHYGGPEYRISARYAFDDSTSVKASYNTGRQYIHMLSNTSAMAPTDIWKLSDPHILPTTGDQYSLGLYRNLKNNTIETSVEVYYRHIYNFLDYKSGAILVMNPHIETDVLPATGRAYGVEFLAKKATGKFNGWISYTYSRTLLRADNSRLGQVVNNGNWYPADYDEPNDFNFIGNYRINHRVSVSLNTIYTTGRPITLPIGVYYYAGSQRALYSDRNAYRIPDYFRMDFGVNIEGNHRIHQKTHNSWSFGVYNLTGRQNPYSVYFVSQNGVINGYKLSVFGSAIPYINYNIRF